MAADYTEEINDAYTDILAAGLLSEIRKLSISGYDPVEGTALDTFVTSPAAIVSVPSSEGFHTDQEFMAGLAKGERKVFLVAAKGLIFKPEAGHFVLFDGALWEVGAGQGKGGVKELNLSGSSIMFTLGCFKSGRLANSGQNVEAPHDDPEVVVYTTADEAVVVSENEPIDTDGREDGTIYIQLCDE